MTNLKKQIDNVYMQHALELAYKAAAIDEVPVGAVLVMENRIIGQGFNQSIRLNDPTAHAEIIAIRDASKKMQNYRLPNSTLYVTLEPCPMCAYAMIHARIDRLVYGAADYRTGACGGAINLLEEKNWNHNFEYSSGPLAKECGHVLRRFFQDRRRHAGTMSTSIDDYATKAKNHNIPELL